MSKSEMLRIAAWLRNEIEYVHALADGHTVVELPMLQGTLDYLIKQLEAGKTPAIRTTPKGA